MCRYSSNSEYAKAVPIEYIGEMKGHPSFHGTISREEAELQLKKHKSNCFLTRYDNGVHILTVMAVLKEDGRVFQHFQLKTHCQNGCYQFEVDGSGNRFDKVSALLDFYKCNPLNYTIDHIGKCITMGPYYRDRSDTDSGEVDEIQQCLPNPAIGRHENGHGSRDNPNPAVNSFVPSNTSPRGSHHDAPGSRNGIEPQHVSQLLKAGNSQFANQWRRFGICIPKSSEKGSKTIVQRRKL